MSEKYFIKKHNQGINNKMPTLWHQQAHAVASSNRSQIKFNKIRTTINLFLSNKKRTTTVFDLTYSRAASISRWTENQLPTILLIK